MARMSVQNDAAYRLDFFVSLFNAFAHLGSMLLGMWVVYHNTDSVNGWRAAHMLVLIGVFRMMSGAIALFIAPNMRLIMEDVHTGGLDFVLIRPVSSQFLVSSRRIAIWRSADVVLGAIVSFIGAALLSQDVSAGRVLLFAAMLLAACMIMYSFWLALATLSFWLIRVPNLEMVFWNIFESARYPISIYPRGVRFALTYLLPAAFVVSFPAQALVGGADAGVPRLDAGIMASAFVVAPLSFALASGFWRFGLRHYSGASA